MSCNLRAIRYQLHALVVTFDDDTDITLTTEQHQEYTDRFIQAYNAPPNVKEQQVNSLVDWLISLKPTPI